MERCIHVCAVRYMYAYVQAHCEALTSGQQVHRVYWLRDLFPSSSINGHAGCGHGTDGERLKLWRVWKMETRLLHSKNAGCKSKLDTIYLLYMANSSATGLAPSRCCLSRLDTPDSSHVTAATYNIQLLQTNTRQQDFSCTAYNVRICTRQLSQFSIVMLFPFIKLMVHTRGNVSKLDY